LLIPFAFLPLVRNVKDTNGQLKDQKMRLKRLSDKISVLNSLNEQDINSQLSQVETALPSNKSVAALVVGIQNLAAGTNLIVDGITLSPGPVATASAKPAQSTTPVPSTPTTVSPSTNTTLVSVADSSLTLDINLTGSISSFKEFLSRLERAKRLSFVDNINFTQNSKGSYDVSISLITPFRSVPQLSGDIVSNPLPTLSSQNEETLKIINEFVDYTNIQIPETSVGVQNPFK